MNTADQCAALSNTEHMYYFVDYRGRGEAAYCAWICTNMHHTERRAEGGRGMQKERDAENEETGGREIGRRWEGEILGDWEGEIQPENDARQ